METTTKKKVSVTKKTVTKTVKVKVPVTVTAESAFWTVDGGVFHSLTELIDGLKTMERRVYQFHADADYQDFAVWTRDVLKDKTAAQLLKKAKSAKEAHIALTKHLKSSSK